MPSLLDRLNGQLPNPDQVYRADDLIELLGLPKSLTTQKLIELLPGADIGDGVHLFSGRLIRDYLAVVGLEQLRENVMKAEG